MFQVVKFTFHLYPSNISISDVAVLRRGTCGMMVSFVLRSCRPMSPIHTPSMKICPLAASMIRKNAKVNEDLPAPVRPTTPICNIQICCILWEGRSTISSIFLMANSATTEAMIMQNQLRWAGVSDTRSPDKY